MPRFVKGQSPWNKGLIGYKAGHPAYSDGLHFKGKKHTTEAKEKMRLAKLGKPRLELRGSNHWKWIEDRNRLKKPKNRIDSAYREWRELIRVRDNWECRINNSDCIGPLEAHHILNWLDYPELRYDTANGILLCSFHHPQGRKEEERLVPVFQELVTNPH